MTIKQVEFLCYEGREALFGGAAGGGKSVALLAAALQWIEEPGTNSLILRRTYKQLSKSDSILNKSKEWLMNRSDAYGRKATWNGDEKKWTFPNGNTLEFGHMEHEDAKYNYQGGIWAFIGVDEATQFTESMLAYPRTRQRRAAGSRTPLRWRGATNPGGVGHGYIKARYIKDDKGLDPSTPNRQFFPAKLSDNPNIDREEYVNALLEAGVDPLTLAQLLEGDWDAVPGGRFRRDWFRDYHWRGDYCVLRTPAGEKEFLPKLCYRFLTIDPAASESNHADWTVVSAWAVSPWSDLVWLGCDRFRADIPDIVPRIARSAKRFRPRVVGIEAIFANRAVLQLAERWTDPAMACIALDKAGQDKLVHASGAMVFAQNGRLYLPTASADPSFPRADVESELVRFTGTDQDANDDIVDTLSYAVEIVTDQPTGTVISNWSPTKPLAR